ncbi:MAG: phosphoribosylglycinamide formyltransferase 1, partial [Solirubrobacteraceae bacterium]|nr:phosphoribosylglycinamide formyltransferase 1 [Solirubrobacteraceae bacterium]
GATVHLVDAGLDTGPVLAQRPVPVHPADDEAVLHERIKTVERELLVQTVAELVTATSEGEPPMTDRTPIRRALLGVFDKAGIEDLAAGLAAAGVEARAYYRTPVHRQPAMAPYAAGGAPLPATDELARTHLAIPMSPLLGAEQAEQVVAAARAALG